MLFSALNTATTAEAQAAAGSNYIMIVVMVLMVVALYFFMIRPQKKREKKATELRNSIEVGDEVTTIGGIIGRVVSIKEDTFVIETAGERSRMRFKRWSIQDVNKLTLETEPEAAAATPANKPEKKSSDSE